MSLAEVVIAIGVLAVVILTLVGLVVTGLSAQDKGEENVAAVHLAESEMDMWKARPYQEIAALVGVASAPSSRISDGREYTCQLKVERLVDDNPDGRILRLTVHLDWMESTGLGEGGSRLQRPVSFELDSIVAPGAAL